ncbi:leucine-rich_repeat domain-containing protein [Hexamita inflata]|uniref:Leucine-rich repeat domain-containing protein n=1 Tax=Hexamita inflata TaxID=28002 RepID=A0AA86U480_9EUKA|nr:leucine-rich repeat domain-containing protein [Hexamita inflata]
MKHNHVIESKEDLLNHFGSYKKLEILDLKQIENLLEMNVPPEVWEDASNRNLLSFSLELIQGTTEFRFKKRWIQYFHLISFFINLTELDLSENNISDISSIYKLKNLKKINLSINRIADISALKYLLYLTHLNLQVNQLTSYTLALPNLIELRLRDNKLQDIYGLQYSPKLESLNLFNTEATDLRTIPHQLFSLKLLYLSSNSITEISYLSNFVDLKILYLSYNYYLSNIGPLKFCTQLTELYIFETRVADIWPLQYLENLKILDMNIIYSSTSINSEN